MIKILQIMDNLDIRSGVSSIVMNLYRNIDRDKLQFDFMVSCPVDQSYESEILKLGGKVFYIGNPLAPQTFFSTCKKSKNFFKKYGYQYTAVHLQSPTIAEMTIRYAKQYGIKKIIIHSHSTMFSRNVIKKIINYLLVMRIKKYATDYWYCSTEAANFLYGKDYMQLHSSEWIRNAIDVENKTFKLKVRCEVRRQLNLVEKKVACHISNFAPVKNTEFLVEVINKIVNKDPTWRFLFVGDGPCKKILENRLEKEKLNQYCVFIGFSRFVGNYLNASDVLLLPSIKEGLPVVTIEAQATGLPCLVSNTITCEANLGGITYLTVQENIWVNSLKLFQIRTNKEREKASVEFCNSMFNIKKEAIRVQKLYLSMK